MLLFLVLNNNIISITSITGSMDKVRFIKPLFKVNTFRLFLRPQFKSKFYNTTFKQFSNQKTQPHNNYFKNIRFYTSIASITLFSAYILANKNIIFNETRVEGSQPFIENNWQEFPDPQPQNTLTPDSKQATFEMGLYVASQEQKRKEKKEHREKQTSRKYLGGFYRIGYFFKDYVYEPIITFGRFIELSMLFLPIVMTYPIVYFGKMNKVGERAGAMLWYKLVRVSAEWCGASFIKLGQWAASRTDMFSIGMCEELSKLHSNAKEHSFNQTKKILKETFNGKGIDEIFDEIYEKPIGCGAIAQVYLAKLNKQFVEGDDHDSLVAVKVVHPNVEITIERDLKIMNFFANFVDCIPTMEWLSLPEEVEQFSILMKLQLDLRIESYNLTKFKEKFPNKNQIKFPKAHFSSRKVLIEERINGVSMNKILDLKHLKGKKMLKQVSDHLIDAFLKMLILDNFIHADLHPGNIFVRFVKKSSSDDINEYETDKLTEKLNNMDNKALLGHLEALNAEDYRPQICFIDAGLVTELDDKNRFNFISLFNALAQFDGYKAGELMIERSKTPETAINKEVFKLKVEKLVDRIKERTFTLGSVSIGDLLDKMLGMVRSHHVRMEGDFVSVVVAILILEGICRQLDPEIDLFARCVFAWNFGFPTV